MTKKPVPKEPVAKSKPADEIDVGRRLRELRATRELSLRALAEQSGLNVNTLSLIENRRTSPSVSTLQQLAQTLQVPISAFFETDHGDRLVVHQKAGNRPRAAFTHGLIEDLGAGMPRFGAEPFIVTLAPKVDSGKTPIVHTGREFVYCLEGHIAYSVDSETYLLEPGDSLLFEAYLPHHWKNMDATPSRNLLLLCPLDERDQPEERHFSK
ncbi:MAG: cupin domain-containing protein [Chloroflexi bacterium]|jgi:transcriptional regulator with XRE-family HTH domain|nr:cupin domain-containing protein [Chloroflexota bacterium]